MDELPNEPHCSDETPPVREPSSKESASREQIDELELRVGDTIIVGGQSLTVLSIEDGEATFELDGGFALGDGPKRPRPPR